VVQNLGQYRVRAEERRTVEFLDLLPETQEFVPGVDPINETPVPATAPSRKPSRPMSDDEFLGSMMSQSVTNPVDPILEESVKNELKRGGGQPLADAADTGR
jgi:hypothetical protein